MDIQTITHTIEPVYDTRAEILMLGSIPSPKSREIRFYYGHPQNRFWRVMARLFDEPLPTTNDRRRDLLLRHHIALWDVLAQCDIAGANDASIENAKANDLRRILDVADIRAVFCTGAKSAALYRRLCEPATGIPCTQLPSTSPANAAWNLERLVEAYRAILPHLTSEPDRVLPVSDVVALEQRIARQGTSLAELMERAGLWLAHRAHALRPQGRAIILCGNGNNGGDGWVAARHLASWGHDVMIVCAKPASDLHAEPAHSAALETLSMVTTSDEKASTGQGTVAKTLAAPVADLPLQVCVAPTDATLARMLKGASVVVDAILGTGFSGETVKEPFATWIALANAAHDAGTTIVAADVPSGMNADTGTAAQTTIHADETVTMIVNKPGLTSPATTPYTANVTVAHLAYLA